MWLDIALNVFGKPAVARLMRHLQQLGNQFEISIPNDDQGYLGRECPKRERHFKITPGTGLTVEDLQCHCPYCGPSSGPDKFFTKAQVEYAESVVINKVTFAVIKDLKSLETKLRPSRGLGIGLTLKVEGKPEAIRHCT